MKTGGMGTLDKARTKAEQMIRESCGSIIKRTSEPHHDYAGK